MRRFRLLSALTVPDGVIPEGEVITVDEAEAKILRGAIGLAEDLGEAEPDEVPAGRLPALAAGDDGGTSPALMQGDQAGATDAPAPAAVAGPLEGAGEEPASATPAPEATAAPVAPLAKPRKTKKA